MNTNKKNWIYFFDDDKNYLVIAIASVLNAYYEKNYSFAKNLKQFKQLQLKQIISY